MVASVKTTLNTTQIPRQTSTEDLVILFLARWACSNKPASLSQKRRWELRDHGTKRVLAAVRRSGVGSIGEMMMIIFTEN
jgi:hypothetical protein